MNDDALEFLSAEVGRRLQEHLEPIQLKPEATLELNSKADWGALQDEKSDAYDLVISNMSLFQIAEPEKMFAQVARVLKAHGLFIFSTLGPDTFKEVTSKKTIHLVDMHDLGDALVGQHLIDPVMEMEMIGFSYDSVEECQAEARSFNFVEDVLFDDKTNCHLSFEIIYGHAWKSDKSFAKDGEVRIPIALIKKS